MSTSATAYSMLVGKTAAGAACAPDAGSGTFTRVVAGNANLSLLYAKISQSQPPCGVQMPQGGPYLSATQVAQVAAWINAGALNN
jgi:hypothetical protein